MAEVAAVAEPLELAEPVVALAEPPVGRALAVRPGPTVVSRDPVAPEASTAARPDQLVAGAAVPPAGWVVLPWIVPSPVLAALEHQESTVQVVLALLVSTGREASAPLA